MANLVQIKVKGADKLKKRIEKVFNYALNENTLTEIAQDIEDQQSKILKQGYYVSRGQRVKLPPLAESTVKARKRNEGKVTTAPWYRTRKSNLTFTGQMIDALTHKINITTKVITIFFGETIRREFHNKKEKVRNSEIAEYHSERLNSPLIGLTEQMKSRVNKMVLKRLRELLKQF